MKDYRIERLMIATDGSPASQKAAKEGIKIAKAFGSKVYGICVGEIPLWGMQLIEEMQKRAKEIVEELKTQVESEGLECEVIPEVGDDIADCIIREVNKHAINLVVVGKRIKRPFLGGVAIKVLTAAPCDVIVVPEEAEISFERFVVAVDGSLYSEIAAEKAFVIAKNLSSKVTLVSVAEKSEDEPYVEEALEITEQLAKKYELSVEKVKRKGDVPEEIVKVAEEENVGLIVMGSHGKSSEKYSIGDVIRKVFEITHIPLFVSKKPS